MIKVIPAIFTLCLCACSSVLPNKAVETREWKTAECSGAQSWVDCNRQADSHCSKGYDIANKEENLVTGLRRFEFSCRN
jgi:hypothetical protein